MSIYKDLLYVVPNLPPIVDGVGDYALKFATELKKKTDLKADYLIGKTDWKGPEYVNNFCVRKIDNKNSDELFNVLKYYNTITLHYVGYGYDKRGCPHWLISSISKWKKAYPERKLITIFHEIYATSYKPWESSFWLSYIQKKLALKLVNMSNYCITSNSYYLNILKSLNKSCNNELVSIPIFSNIGEPLITPKIINRERAIVIFGRKRRRLLIYKNYIKEMIRFCNHFNIQYIYDIGEDIGENFDNEFQNVKIKSLGILEENEISKILLNSYAGAGFFTNPNNLTKSGVYAAFCSHKVVPLVFFTSNNKCNELESGVHYLSLKSDIENLEIKDLEMIAESAYNWYQNHNLKNFTSLFANLLKN